VGGIQLSNGDFAVVLVKKVVEPDPSTIEESEKLTLKRTIAGARGEVAFENLLNSIKQSASIQILEDNI
jgi:hypothetical protein